MRLVLALCLWASLSAAAAPAGDWMLLGREGGCAPITSLRRKLPTLPELRSPDALAAWLRAQGHAVTRTEPAPGLVGVSVPALGLELLLTPASRCAASPAH